jgi:alanine racemase
MAYITLNKKNFFYNLDIISKQTKSKDKIALVLKDNAYGHGLLEMAQLASEYGITKAVVQRDEEAVAISAFFEYILVLAEIPKEPSEKVRYVINDLRDIEKFPKNTRVELKVNTGMNRNGVEIDELLQAFDVIKMQGLRLEGVLTHHACADELGEYYEMQCENFQKVKELSPKGLRFHSCNSAALFRAKEFDEDMARVGIAAYGCMELPAEINTVELQPVLSVFAKKNSTRRLQSGARVGYGGTYLVEKETVVSNYDFGYGDGFFRACSKAYKTPEGVELAGRISMDNASFVSNVKTLLIFNDARVISKVAGTFSYEVLISLKPDIRREIV